ncbi:SGNH/GDSL hydrolase family protein [Pseudomonas vancouverensis]|uniref:SGNH/GDSL hydrolase family protein n=1 Tax=Pseudomonas vancouverensis TaxID=95300 RepID=A0A1H2NU01_PSEVA|nr:SGNH/GDSL hydrolase family protein [Pseudomonas vancouverensis]KAB0496309.1 SGNH/GDSL hydrolase family protein [Pseudomonas vancouverensis]TDB64983.1 SGNH/GDSL hydrolase family protein [Pseudomonas vancouverensis]SDV08912.1 Lysophospholipase L1 [Pseudomonas vancouverensis]
MSHTETLAKLLLGPLLLLQGLHTRRVTPKLPEAEGERRGEAGDGASLRVLIVGDSAAAGVGALTQDQALSGRLVKRLAERHRVSWQLWARSGLDSQALLDLLEQQVAEPFDVALLSIGVNDVTGTLAVDPWIDRQQRLMKLLCDKFAVKLILVSPVPPMHLFPALPQPLRWFLGFRARRFNTRLADLTTRLEQCTLLNISLAPEAGLMASDGFHPGPKIYSQWADDAARVIDQRFAQQ